MRSVISRAGVPAALVLSLAALTACGGGDDSGAGKAAGLDKPNAAEAAWIADVEKAMGAELADVEVARQQALQDCTRTTSQEWTVELALSGVSSATDVTRVNLDHLCSEVVPAFDEARASVEGADSVNALLCGMPAAEVPAAAAQQVAMVCGR